MTKKKFRQKQQFENVFWINSKLATENLTPRKQVYGEKLVLMKNKEYRIWDPTRSKPAAAIYKGLKQFPIKRGMKILYLGIASGTSASHMSDIIGRGGLIYGVDVSERVLRDLLPVAKDRGNIVPVLANAATPEEYYWVEQVDLVYADVAIREQSQILIRNSEMFLKPDGYAMIAIKSRSIDVTAKPSEVYKQQRKILERVFDVVDFVTLDPYERDHCMFVLKAKK